jgi:hypothetical protein
VTQYLHFYTTHRDAVQPVVSYTVNKYEMFLGTNIVSFQIPKLYSAHFVLHSLLGWEQHGCYSVMPGMLFYVCIFAMINMPNFIKTILEVGIKY